MKAGGSPAPLYTYRARPSPFTYDQSHSTWSSPCPGLSQRRRERGTPMSAAACCESSIVSIRRKQCVVVHYQNQVHQTMLSQGHLWHSWGNLVLIMQVQLCVRVWQTYLLALLGLTYAVHVRVDPGIEAFSKGCLLLLLRDIHTNSLRVSHFAHTPSPPEYLSCW